jgi:negative regulator of flagellin synthesis FlgM
MSEQEWTRAQIQERLAMEITGKGFSIQFDAYVKNAKHQAQTDHVSGKTAEKQTKTSGIVTEDKVKLSQRAQKIQEARRQLDALPDVREEHVARIRQQVDAGTYQIESGKIAAKMIEDALLSDAS